MFCGRVVHSRTYTRTMVLESSNKRACSQSLWRFAYRYCQRSRRLISEDINPASRVFARSVDTLTDHAHAAATNILCRPWRWAVMRLSPGARVHHLPPKVRRPRSPLIRWSQSTQCAEELESSTSTTARGKETEVLFALRTSNAPDTLITPSDQWRALTPVCCHIQSGQVQPY
jgi:hypothetical protein